MGNQSGQGHEDQILLHLVLIERMSYIAFYSFKA